MIRWALSRLGAWVWPLAAALLAASHLAAFCGAWSWRGDREAAHLAEARDRQQAALIRAAEDLSRAEYDLRQRNEALTARAQEHTRAILADPRACLVPDPDELSRLRARWRPPAPPAD